MRFMVKDGVKVALNRLSNSDIRQHLNNWKTLTANFVHPDRSVTNCPNERSKVVKQDASRFPPHGRRLSDGGYQK